ncbi:intraflagellar transport protein 46 homolog [Fopius arisanus]|uniref:Intraflagellar transport protein 46 homolog n=1 Tax=Fopius arisanus TaxID=64838 RepID=A0A9R1SWI1_9HYME|nr:PREDICTED: intraflagellar transport protein 46 homolog [Fopius arisanus]
MDVEEKSSEEEDTPQNISAFTKYDESIIVTNAEEIKSPVYNRTITMKNSKNPSSDISDDLDINSTSGPAFRMLSTHEESFQPASGVGSDPSDSEETDDDDIEGTNVKKPIELYDAKEFDELDVSTEVRELFQNITRYTPQKMELSYKVAPYIPDFIPAVGDIDAFIKVPRPDGVDNKIGLIVLDEPCANQSEPAVLHLQLRSQSKSSDTRQQVVIKRIEEAEKNRKSIEKWIDDLNILHRSKHPPAVRLSEPMPDIDSLMQQWPSEVENTLNDTQLDLTKFDCDLPHLVDIVCNLMDIPVKPETRLESLYTLFSLFLEVRDIKDSTSFSV